MAIDTTQTLVLTETPVEIVSTLGLAPGEYRIENTGGPPDSVFGEHRILFVASQDLIEGRPDHGHALVLGAREDIGIENGQRWYFWSANQAGATLAITPAGRAIGGSPPVIRLPSFHVDIFRVLTSATLWDTTAAPVGGAYDLSTAQLTPPEDWSESQVTLQSGDTEYHARAIIDPNTEDVVITPVWGIPQQVNLIGTINGIVTEAPLAGGATAGTVTLSVQTRGITEGKIANDAISLRTMAGGTPGRVLGFDAQGDPAEIERYTSVTQLDVPALPADTDLVLGQASGGGFAWVAQTEEAPEDTEFFYGDAPPPPLTQVAHNDIWFVSDDASGISDTVGMDRVTAKTTINRGDIFEWDETAGAAGTGSWVFRAPTNTQYPQATTTTGGLLTDDQAVHLASIDMGAEVNRQADWTETDTDSDAYIQNKPTIPAAQVPADWDEDTSVARILNKPTSVTAFDVPDYSTQPDNRVLGLDGGMLEWIETGAHRIFFGPTFPATPAAGNHIFFTNLVTGLGNYFEADGTTVRTSARRGEVGLYRGGKWLHQQTVNTEYPEATDTEGGVITDAQAVKLAGIAPGADTNVQANWAETDSDDDTFIKNKPTIPTIPGNATSDDAGLMSAGDKAKLDTVGENAEQNVQADWDADTGDARILNKPTIPNVPTAPTMAGTFELTVPTTGAASWTAAVVPGVPTISAGGGLPSNPGEADTHFMTETVTANVPTNVVDGDGTRLTTLNQGDIFRYDGTNWVWRGTMGRLPDEATQAAPGLMSAADKTKLDGIATSAEVNVQSNWTETDADSDAFILNKPTIPTVPGAATTAAAGLMSSADKTKLDGVASGAEVNVQSDWEETDTDADSFIANKPTIPTIPGEATTTVDGLLSADDKAKLDGIASGAEVNVQSDWNETDTSADSYIDNKPTIPTIPGNATTSQAGLMSSADKTKLAGIATGAEVNVHADWTETDTDSDAYIQNKPTIPPAQEQSDWSETSNTAVSFILNKPTALTDFGFPAYDANQNGQFLAVRGGGLVWRDEDNPVVPDIHVSATVPASARANELWFATADITTAVPTNIIGDDGDPVTAVRQGQIFRFDLTNWDLQGPVSPHYDEVTTTVAGLMSAADKTKLDGIDAGAEANVQVDWGATAGDAFIRNKPTIPNVPNTPGAETDERNYNLRVGTDGVASWQQDTGGGTSAGEENVQTDWDETDTASDAYLLNKPSIPTIPGVATQSQNGLMSSIDKAKLDQIPNDAEANVQVDWNENDTDSDAFISNKPTIPVLPSAPSSTPDQRDYNLRVATDGTTSWQQDTGGGATGGEDNVQTDWNETDTDSDAFLRNKPTDSEIGDKAFSNPPGDLTDTEKTAVRTAIGAGTGSGTGTGEENVQSDWDETDTDDDAFILNKPDLAGRFMGSWAARTAYAMGDVTFSTGQFWRAKQDVPDDRTGAPTNDLDYWQQSTFSIGIASSLPTFTDDDEFDLNRDRWIILTAAERLSGTRDGSGALPYVADVQDTRTVADITGNQITDLNRGDILRVDTWPTRYWARMVNGGASTGEANVQTDWNETDTASDAFLRNKPTIPTIPGNATDTTAGLMSGLDKAKLDTIATAAEVNVQANWDTTNTTNDSYIQNKPTDAEFGDKAFSNPPGDLTDAEKTAARNAIGAGTGSGTGTGEENVQANWTETDTASDAFIQNKPTNAEIGDTAFSNPPTDLTDAEKTAARNAIGAGTGSGTGTGEENVQANWDETDTASDAYIQNKPTIPTVPTDAQIGDKAFSNSPTDLTDTEKADVRRNIDLADSQIGVLAFRNPPGNLTSTQQSTVRTAIGAGTGSGGTTTFAGLTDTPASLGTAGQYLRVNSGATALEFIAAPTGGGASTFAGLTDTPAALGSAGQFLRVNSAGTALEFVAAPGGGGSPSMNQYLPPPDERTSEGGYFYMGWTDDFNSGWGIRRVDLSTGAATTATETGNMLYSTLTAAWPNRATVTYS